jgi:MYXO-CTERM domain-containing protein
MRCGGEQRESGAPEPATLALAALSLTALGFTRRRSK